MKVLEVLHLATYESFGGAARASQRIYQALKTWPILCHMFTLLKTSEDESIFVVQPKEPHEQLKYIHALLTSNLGDCAIEPNIWGSEQIFHADLV